METANKSVWKSTMNYGAILGLVFIVYSLLLSVTGLTSSKLLVLLSYLLPIAGIYYATKHYRDKKQNGTISYGKAVAIGLLTSIFAAVILAFITYIQLKYIDSQAIEKQMASTAEQMANSGLPENQIEMTVNLIKNPLFMTFIVILGFAFFGLIISLITSGILSKEEDPFRTDNKNVENN